jgi:vitamin B12/bleomycin/antimicrobial peptide transport system ATP-binding/permease protein
MDAQEAPHMTTLARFIRAVKSAIEIAEVDGRLAYERLTLSSSTNASPLLKDLSISIPVGARVLVTGPNQAAGIALFRATAGLSPSGSGRIVRPDADRMGFLPQRPYLPPGTLRQVLDGAGHADEPSDDRLFNPADRAKPGTSRDTSRRIRFGAGLENPAFAA